MILGIGGRWVVLTAARLRLSGFLPRLDTTYVNVDLLSVTLGTTDGSSDNDQLVLGNEVTDASLVLAAT